ncbi:phytanoyl-CoA dioxygenase family protein [Arenimonas sp. MALMAid1274]|uniref:phytanoyl-CoA dioxygenase family protein n=1 Tax=Arenimonas sp. MALMAid1274 TaxID=3411630 RepID=UPI003BA17121
MDIATFRREMATEGYALFPEQVPGSLLQRLRLDIPIHFRKCEAIQRRTGVGGEPGGVAHHVLGERDSLDEFLAMLFLDDYLQDYFAGKYILNSFGAVDNLRDATARYEHGHRFHRDVRTYSGDFRLMVNMLVMVDSFTPENGATRLVPGSHRSPERPTEPELEARAVRAVGQAGGIVLFDSNLWHAAAPNLTQGPRKALTLTFSRPFVKPQMDYPRLLGEDFTDDPGVRQVLGYNARVPKDHEQWYQPPERRMYKPGQG